MMNDKESCIILSIIISTYNRSSLMKKNLLHMLHCKADNIEFIIGDNASTDDTWDILSNIEDRRLRKFHNEINLNIDNFCILTQYASGKFFIFVNDRDFIYYQDIDKLSRSLKQIDADYISYERSEYKRGYYSGYKAMKIIFDSRHPGTYVWNTSVYQKSINYVQLRENLVLGKYDEAAELIYTDLLFRVNRIYLSKEYLVHQPKNREKIKKNRQEINNNIYISLQFGIDYFNRFIKICKNHTSKVRCHDILVAGFDNCQMTMMMEYYYSLKKPGFSKRNSCENLKTRDWAKNGILFLIYVIKNKYTRSHTLDFLIVTIHNFYKTLLYILKSKILKNRS